MYIRIYIKSVKFTDQAKDIPINIKIAKSVYVDM